MTEQDALIFVEACPNLEHLILNTNNKRNLLSVECIKVFNKLQRLKFIELSYCKPLELLQCENVLKENNPYLKVCLHTEPI